MFDINKLLQNKKILLILALLLGLLILIIQSYFSPAKKITIAPVDSITNTIVTPKMDTRYNQIPNNSISVNPNIDLSKIPNTVNVYSYADPTFTESDAYQLFDKLALKYYSQSDDPVLGKVLFASNGNQNAVAYLGRKKFNFNDATNFSVGITREDNYFKQRAEQYLKSIGLSTTNYQLLSTKYIGGTITEREVVQNKSSAVSVELQYVFETDSNIVIPNENNMYGNRIIIWITNNGQVQKFSYEFGGSIGDKLGQSQIISKEKIIQNINNGQAKFVSTILNDQNYINSIEVKDAKIAYYAKEGELFPILYMIGAVKTDKEDSAGYLIMDATENEKK